MRKKNPSAAAHSGEIAIVLPIGRATGNAQKDGGRARAGVTKRDKWTHTMLYGAAGAKIWKILCIECDFPTRNRDSKTRILKIFPLRGEIRAHFDAPPIGPK